MARSFGMRICYGTLAVVASAAPAFAHPGHGADGGSHELTHYVTEPVHLAPLGLAALAGIAAAGVVAWVRRKT